MIKIIVDTRDEYRVVNHLIHTGIINSTKEDLKLINSMLGDRLDTHYTIKENKKKWWQKLFKKSSLG